MWDSAASSGRTRAVRANVKAKRYGDLAKMVASFLRTGTAEIPDPSVTAKWGLENETFWNVAHAAGEVGKAMEYEGKTAKLSAEEVAALRGTTPADEVAGVYEAFRGQALPQNEGAELWIKLVAAESTFARAQQEIQASQ